MKGNVRRSVRAHNPPFSQIAGHLNKVPIKIQSLSLLIGSGGVTGSTNVDFSSFEPRSRCLFTPAQKHGCTQPQAASPRGTEHTRTPTHRGLRARAGANHTWLWPNPYLQPLLSFLVHSPHLMREQILKIIFSQVNDGKSLFPSPFVTSAASLFWCFCQLPAILAVSLR